MAGLKERLRPVLSFVWAALLLVAGLDLGYVAYRLTANPPQAERLGYFFVGMCWLIAFWLSVEGARRLSLMLRKGR